MTSHPINMSKEFFTEELKSEKSFHYGYDVSFPSGHQKRPRIKKLIHKSFTDVDLMNTDFSVALINEIYSSSEKNLLIDSIETRLDELEADLDDDYILSTFYECKNNMLRLLTEFSFHKKPLIGVTDFSTITVEWRDASNKKVLAFIHLKEEGLVEFVSIIDSNKMILEFNMQSIGSNFIYRNCIQNIFHVIERR